MATGALSADDGPERRAFGLALSEALFSIREIKEMMSAYFEAVPKQPPPAR